MSATEVYRRLAGGGPSCLLNGTGWFDGRYSVIALSPFAAFRSRGSFSEWFDVGDVRGHPSVSERDPLAHLQRQLDRFRDPSSDATLRMGLPLEQGAAIGLFGYDLARQFENIPGRDDSAIPDILLFFFDLFVIVDPTEDRLHIVFHPTPRIRIGQSPDSVDAIGKEAMERVERALQSPPLEQDAPLPARSEVVYDSSPDHYRAQVRRVLEYIAAGDVFQVNLSHRLRVAASAASAWSAYRRLMQINPSPFSAYLNLEEIQIACGSPERLVSLRADGACRRVETWPIAGTRPRGKTPDEDRERVAALYASRKECAEHLMLVDLERNDLGRVCRHGSVRVESLMEIEKYSHVIHLVSRVCGELAPDTDSLDVLRALFPGGTITGVPKVRCMEIIAELEGTSRGLYTGSVGYLGFDGTMDLNIAIRTWVQCGQEMSAQVGAGIVADSDPAAEYQETLDKAAALLAALGV